MGVRGSETGCDRNITAWIKVKIAVVPPIPKASVSTAAAVKTGDNRNCRRAYRRLPGRFGIEHLSILYAAQAVRVPEFGKLLTPLGALLLTLRGVVCHRAVMPAYVGWLQSV